MNILPKWGFPPSEETKFLMTTVEEARTKINAQKRIFLAIPYTGVEEYSYTISEQYTLKLVDRGYSVFFTYPLLALPFKKTLAPYGVRILGRAERFDHRALGN